jgi:hypothetical protein
MNVRLVGWLALTLCGAPSLVGATGHGPVFGLATPTLGRGAWSLDLSVMDRSVGGKQSAMLRPLVARGLTEDVQLSLSLPMPLYMPQGLPHARTMAMMPSTADAEFLLGWRFHRKGPAVGARSESTAFVGFDYPTDAVRGGVRTAPGLYLGAVTGHASRSVYVWAGVLGRRYMSPVGQTADRPGSLGLYSLVVGYRPGPFRKELPHPDWRAFVELVGEYNARDRLAGEALPNSGGHQVFIAPTLLGIYRNWGISGGPAFPVYSKLNGTQPKDRVRLVVNFTRWF